MKLKLLVFGVLVLSACPFSQADTLLIKPENPFEVGDNGEVFPESRFGAPPARIETGVSEQYAAKATTAMDQLREDRGLTPGNSAADRTPAGLVYSDTTSISHPPQNKVMEDMGEVAAMTDKNMVATMNVSSQISRRGVQEVSIIANDLGYFPKTIFVAKDVPVRIFVTGASKNTLCIMMDSFQVRRQIRSQKIEEITFTPATPGKYRFYCPVNGMEGSMIVKELTTS